VILKLNEKFKRNILLSVGVCVIYNRHGPINLQVSIINENFDYAIDSMLMRLRTDRADEIDLLFHWLTVRDSLLQSMALTKEDFCVMQWK
jgi:hypothetical protein